MPVDPGNNWLDRLRSSRGFPTISAEVDLDEFLLLPDSNPRAAETLPSAGRKNEKEGEKQSEGRKWTEVVGSALAELFRMENPTNHIKFPTLKNPRKQKKPKIFGTNAPVYSSDVTEYSRTEVTVIDTSLISWKSRKIIFRKGAVWKIRDKKTLTITRKKRKVGAIKRLNPEKWAT